MRFATCYVLVCDGDSAVNWAGFNQLVTCKGLHHFKGFGRSADALLSRPAQLPSLGSNVVGGAAKPVNPNSLFTNRRPQASYQDLDTNSTTIYTLLYNNFVLSLLDISLLPF
jgi:hypothetical protein